MSADFLDVLMVSTSYPVDDNDWRGVFIRHLADSLARHRGLHLYLWSPPGPIAPNATYIANDRERKWLQTLMGAGGIAHLCRSRTWQGIVAPFALLRHLRRAYNRATIVDLFHVNWLQNTLALPRDRRPLLTTVLGSDMHLLSLPGMSSLLRYVFRGRKVAICPNAEWMVPELERRFGDLARVRCVPFGIDPRWFEVKRAPDEYPDRWLCVTRLTATKVGPLFKWGQELFNDGIRELHLFGPMQEQIDVPSWVHYHGPISADALREKWFPVAKGLITLSRHAEGRPQVMLEAMASGLPIIASRIAAHEDLLQDRQTGWLCGNSDEVGLALGTLDTQPANHELGLRAKAWVLAEIGTWDDCADRFAAVYKELTAA